MKDSAFTEETTAYLTTTQLIADTQVRLHQMLHDANQMLANLTKVREREEQASKALMIPILKGFRDAGFAVADEPTTVSVNVKGSAIGKAMKERLTEAVNDFSKLQTQAGYRDLRVIEGDITQVATRDISELPAYLAEKFGYCKPVAVDSATLENIADVINRNSDHRSARAAYHRYGAAVGGVNFQGKPLPSFEELPALIQNGWVAAANS